MWVIGYFCGSVGQVTKQTIEEYIENQKEISYERKGTIKIRSRK